MRYIATGTGIGNIRGMLSPSDALTPYLPEDPTGTLGERAVGLLRRADALNAMVPAELQEQLADLVREMNGYYSNLIEGHNTFPLSIARALEEKLSQDPAKRSLQLEAVAHVEVQRLLAARIASDRSLIPTSADFLRWIHAEFYRRMPAEFRVVKGDAGQVDEVIPGEFRARQVKIGRHEPPPSAELPSFMERFDREYSLSRLTRATERVIAAAASHHRFAWIHPFLDGNGRVARLFTDAYLAASGVGGHGVWTVSRGLARQRDEYRRVLAEADAPRQGDLDGRGQRSNRTLAGFCAFFIETASDQVDFMAGLMEFRGLEARVGAYADRLIARGELHPRAKEVLLTVLGRREVTRGAAAQVSGLGERAGRMVVSGLVERGLVASSTPKGPLRVAFPPEAVPYYFPKLYPAEVELAAETVGDRASRRARDHRR
jgi:Fic family protein